MFDSIIARNTAGDIDDARLSALSNCYNISLNPIPSPRTYC